MWGGGFDSGLNNSVNSPSQFASPSVQKPARRSQNVVATTAKTILDSTGDTLMIGGTEVSMLTIVGLIKAIDIQSTKITYTIDDSTACIEAVKWLENDVDSPEPGTTLMEMTYCKIYGCVRLQQGKKNLMAYKVVPLTDLNQLTTHILEVIHDPLRIQQIASLKGGPDMNTSVAGGRATGAPMETGMSSGLVGPQRLVYQMVQMCKTESGVSKTEIAHALKDKVTEKQLESILGFLSSEGHIYTTVDDETYKSTEC